MFVWFVPPVHVRIFPRPTTLKPVETYYYSHVTYSLQLDEHYNMYGMYETMNCFELVDALRVSQGDARVAMIGFEGA